MHRIGARLFPLLIASILAIASGVARTPALPGTPRHHDLSFEERVDAQRAIERLYYSHQIGAKASLAGSSTLYDVFSGSLSGLLQGAGDYSSGACISASSYSPGFQDELSDPAPGEGVYYLARARNPCATGTFGTPGIDASAAQSTAPCP